MVKPLRNRSGAYTILEMIVVFSLIFIVLVMLHTPTQTILQYPTKISRQRADRISGQRAYNFLYLDLRNSLSEKVWTTESASGDTLLLITSVSRYENADSEGHPVYTLWKYSPVDKQLSRRRWTLEQLADSGLPAVNQGPSAAEWEKYAQENLMLMAPHLQEFSFTQNPPPTFGVPNSIKFKERNGKLEPYSFVVEKP